MGTKVVQLQVVTYSTKKDSITVEVASKELKSV